MKAFRRTKPLVALALLSLPGFGASPAFEVASVKINNDPGRQRGLGPIQYSSDTLTMRGVSMWVCLRWAYGLENAQISGPDAMQGAPFYDIVAKASAPAGQSQMRLMLQTLLADRFHLAVHREKKETMATALIVAKGGPRFHKSAGKYDESLGAEAPFQFLGYDNTVHIQRNQETGGRVRSSLTNASMSVFAAFLEGVASMSAYDKLAVVDMTGLSGRFDFSVVPDPPSHVEGESPASDDPLARWRPALTKQLGLNLVSRKAMLNILVVDRVDKEPTAN